MSSGSPFSCFLLFARLLLGCSALAPGALAGSSMRELKVDAIVDPDLLSRAFLSYEIPVQASPDDDRPWRAAAVHYTKTALSGLGMYEAPPGVRPDLTIEVDSGFGGRRIERRTRAVPVLVPPPFNDPIGTVSIDYATEEYQVSLRLKFLMVTARPHGSSGTLWRVQVALDDETDGLEPCLPLLAAAVMNRVGHDTRGTRTMKLSLRDPDVAFIAQGLP